MPRFIFMEGPYLHMPERSQNDAHEVLSKSSVNVVSGGNGG